MGNARSSVFLGSLPLYVSDGTLLPAHHLRAVGLIDAQSPAALGGYWSRPLAENERFLSIGDWITEEQKLDSFTYLLLQAGGKLSFSIKNSVWGPKSRETWIDGGHWEDNGWGPGSVGTPHYYLALNPLGKIPGQTPGTLLEYVGKNINRLFPWGGIPGETMLRSSLEMCMI